MQCYIIICFVLICQWICLFFCVVCLTVSENILSIGPLDISCLLKQFAICLGVLVILLLKVMEVFSVGGGALLDIPCIVFQIMCVLCM